MKSALQFVTHCLQMIVVALTNFRWLALVFAAMNLGCGTSAIKLQSAETGAITQLLHDEVTSDARRKAHGMEAFVRGKSSDVGMLDPEKLPEAYTPNGEEANRRYQFHLGYAAQRLIRAYYAAAHPAHDVIELIMVSFVLCVGSRAPASSLRSPCAFPVFAGT